jgi:hypothetical protein
LRCVRFLQQAACGRGHADPLPSLFKLGQELLGWPVRDQVELILDGGLDAGGADEEELGNVTAGWYDTPKQVVVDPTQVAAHPVVPAAVERMDRAGVDHVEALHGLGQR